MDLALPLHAGCSLVTGENLLLVTQAGRVRPAGHYAGRRVATPRAVAAGPDRGTAVTAAVAE